MMKIPSSSKSPNKTNVNIQIDVHLTIFIKISKKKNLCQQRNVYLPAGSKHSHFLQYFLTTAFLSDFAQQSPPSYSQPQLLFSSSQLPSPLYFALPHFLSHLGLSSGLPPH